METNQEDDVLETGQAEVVSADEGIELLKKQLADERAARQAAERTARDASAQATSAKLEAHDTNMHLLNASIEQMSEQSDALKNAYAAALARGDHALAANINDEMLETKMKLSTLRNGAEQYKKQLEQQQAQQATQEAGDPVESFASQLTRPSADWIRAHPNCVTNPVLQRKMVRAHQDAIDDNVAPDTPEYFAYIENRLGFKKAEAQEEEDVTAKAVGGRSNSVQPPAAPVSRGGASSRGVRLTPAQRETAKEMGWKEEDYAKWLQDTITRGQMQ